MLCFRVDFVKTSIPLHWNMLRKLCPHTAIHPVSEWGFLHCCIKITQKVLLTGFVPLILRSQYILSCYWRFQIRPLTPTLFCHVSMRTKGLSPFRNYTLWNPTGFRQQVVALPGYILSASSSIMSKLPVWWHHKSGCYYFLHESFTRAWKHKQWQHLILASGKRRSPEDFMFFHLNFHFLSQLSCPIAQLSPAPNC